MQLTARHHEYWKKNLNITAILMARSRTCRRVRCGTRHTPRWISSGWPFSFYMAAQGSLIIYVVIIWYYAHYMNNLDHEYGVNEGEDE